MHDMYDNDKDLKRWLLQHTPHHSLSTCLLQDALHHTYTMDQAATTYGIAAPPGRWLEIIVLRSQGDI